MDYTSTHRDIVEECQAGSRQAQFKLYQLYAKAMYNICLRMVRNELDAEDILQNSFVNIFAKIDTFRFQSSIGAWIKRIVVNNCINFMKKKRLEFQELNDDYKLSIVPEEEPTVRLNVEAVHEAIYQLPDGYRIVFSLYMMEGYDHGEIAEILNISEATSKSQYSRAKRKLKELLSETLTQR